MTRWSQRRLQIGLWITRLHPAPWRVRYGLDMDDLLHQRGVSSGDLANLAIGLLDAHLHVLTWKVRWPAMTPRLRNGLVALVLSWLFLAVAAAALVKASEDGPVAQLMRTDIGVQISVRAAMGAGALGLAVLAISGSRLLEATVRRLAEQRDGIGFGLLLAPLAMAGLFGFATVVAVGHVDQSSTPQLWVNGWGASGLVCAAGSVWAVAGALQRANPSSGPFQLIVPGAVVLSLVTALALVAELLWVQRLATLTRWSHLDGVVGIPLVWAAILVIGCTIVSGVLAAGAASAIHRALQTAR